MSNIKIHWQAENEWDPPLIYQHEIDLWLRIRPHDISVYKSRIELLEAGEKLPRSHHFGTILGVLRRNKVRKIQEAYKIAHEIKNVNP